MSSKPAEEAWPADGIERVPNCPLCGLSERELLHKDLSDRIFFAAPGTWNLWRCRRCRSAWLDPRPTEATIGLAYASYYTHDSDELPAPRNAFQRLRAALGNGYRNARYGTRLNPASPLGPLLASLLPPLGWPADKAYRYLPARAPEEPRRVLDIGCGNGAWLQMARAAGWQGAGVEPDPIARNKARENEFEVRNKVDDWLDEPESFDFVTMSHVIEHVHDPIALLRTAHLLLRPGGRIYVDTPNVDAVGHEIYGRHWRGLEPPRHLILFNRRNLKDALELAGFRDVRYPWRIYPFRGMCEQSRRIEAGQNPYSTQPRYGLSPLPGAIHVLRATFGLRTEFVTAIASKPE